jgi:hypothetical protein
MPGKEHQVETPASGGYRAHAFPVLLDCWQYHIRQDADVVVVTYGCHVLSSEPPLVSDEHRRAGLFAPGQVPGLVMPDGYKRSVTTWFARLGHQSGEGGWRGHDLV